MHRLFLRFLGLSFTIALFGACHGGGSSGPSLDTSKLKGSWQQTSDVAPGKTEQKADSDGFINYDLDSSVQRKMKSYLTLTDSKYIMQTLDTDGKTTKDEGGYRTQGNTVIVTDSDGKEYRVQISKVDGNNLEFVTDSGEIEKYSRVSDEEVKKTLGSSDGAIAGSTNVNFDDDIKNLYATWRATSVTSTTGSALADSDGFIALPDKERAKYYVTFSSSTVTVAHVTSDDSRIVFLPYKIVNSNTILTGRSDSVTLDNSPASNSGVIIQSLKPTSLVLQYEDENIVQYTRVTDAAEVGQVKASGK